MEDRRTNWAGNHVIAGGRLHAPESLEQLQALVAGSRHLRALGTGHTFNDLPDSRGDLVTLAAMPRRLTLADGTVTVDAAMRYGDLAGPLDRAGFALEAMASLGHIGVAGAVATGTHGSGDRIVSLAAIVRGLGMVTADGRHLELDDRRDPDLAGLVVGLGAFGVVTSVTLAVVPTYRMRQDVVEDVPLDTVLDRFEDLTGLGRSVSLFTTWDDRRFHQVWIKRRLDEPADLPAGLPSFRPADGPRHPIPGFDPVACTTQLGVPGPWFERLPHFRLDHTPSSGVELQSEYLVERRHGPAAVAALFEVAPRFRPLVQVSEVRTVAADDRWLSPAYGRASVAIHFTWQPDPAGVRAALDVVEGALAPFDPRPHWGKVWTIPVETVRASYPRLADVAALRDQWDPERVFGNRYVDALLGD